MYYDTFMVSFQLAAARKANGKTKTDIAAEVGVSPATIASWECGASMPRLRHESDVNTAYGIVLVWPDGYAERRGRAVRSRTR